LAYRCALHWGAVFRWELHPAMNLSYPVMVNINDPFHGRDKLRFNNDEGLKDRIWKTLKWIGVWLK
jgi:hypothetical protein